MSDYRLHLMYGRTSAVHHSQLNKQFPLCPHCQTVGGHMVRLRRAWWQRLFMPGKKRYQCLECDSLFTSGAEN